jgi:hypothetical protein
LEGIVSSRRTEQEMKEAVLSVEAFRGDFFLILGSVKAEWNRSVAIYAAIILAIGAAFSVGSEVSTYWKEHLIETLLAFGLLMSVVAYVVWCIFRAHRGKRVPGDKREADGKHCAHICRCKPAGDDGEGDADGEVEEAERPDAGNNCLTGDSGEPPVQPVE